MDPQCTIELKFQSRTFIAVRVRESRTGPGRQYRDDIVVVYTTLDPYSTYNPCQVSIYTRTCN